MERVWYFSMTKKCAFEDPHHAIDTVTIYLLI